MASTDPAWIRQDFQENFTPKALIFELLLFAPRGKGQGCDISCSTREVTAQSSGLGTIELNANFNYFFLFFGGGGARQGRADRRSLELCCAR